MGERWRGKERDEKEDDEDEESSYLRGRELHDPVHVGDVHPSGSHVSAEQDPRLGSNEFLVKNCSSFVFVGWRRE